MLGDPQPLAIRSWRAADQLPHSAELLAHAGVGIWESKGSRENGKVEKKMERRGNVRAQDLGGDGLWLTRNMRSRDYYKKPKMMDPCKVTGFSCVHRGCQ